MNPEFRAGNEIALRDAFNAYYPRAYHFCLRIIGDPIESEDIVLMAFQGLFSRCANFETEGHVIRYLNTAVRNKCTNYLKLKGRNNRRMQGFRELAEDEGLQAIEVEVRLSLIEAIARAVDELPTSCREIFEMVCVQGISPARVAELLGVTPDTVYTQRRRAIEKIKQQLFKNKENGSN